MPYYFQQVGLEKEAAYISIAFNVVIPFGIIVYNQLSKNLTFHEKYLGYLSFGFLTLFYMIFWVVPSRKTLLPYYLLLTILIGVSFSGPIGFIYGT